MKYFLLLQRSQRSSGSFKPLRCCTELFQNYFLPFNISEWNKLNPDVRNVNTSSLFLKNLLALKRPIENSLYSIYDPLGIKLLHRLRLDFSHSCEHKFVYNFVDTMNPLCSCSLEFKARDITFYAATIMSPFAQPL